MLLVALVMSIFVAHIYQGSQMTDINKAEFVRFQRTYNKVYADSSENDIRFDNFVKNRNYILSHRHESYILKMNEFGDMSMEEIRKKYLFDYEPNQPCTQDYCHTCTEDNCYNHGNENITVLPDAVDWRLRGVVSPVKNQGRCGSCWAFSAGGAVESAWAIRNKRIADISTQQMVDCDMFSHGCNGGRMEHAFTYLMVDGVATEENYPYKGIQKNCSHNFTRSSVQVLGYGIVAESRPLAMKRAVAFQPVSVAVAVNENVIFYGSGIFGGECGTRLNHAVLLTGYSDKPQKYWNIKNSWGESWGELGYMRMSRTEKSYSQETCGVAVAGLYPIVAK